MVTVLPVTSNSRADKLNSVSTANDETIRNDVCQEALLNYDLVQAQSAMKKAEAAASLTNGLQSLDGRGPFLLAWSPGQTFGSNDALVLVADLSNTSTPEQAFTDFDTWRKDIEQDPSKWQEGWNIEAVRIFAQRWVDRRGYDIIKLLGKWS